MEVSTTFVIYVFFIGFFGWIFLKRTFRWFQKEAQECECGHIRSAHTNFKPFAKRHNFDPTRCNKDGCTCPKFRLKDED